MKPRREASRRGHQREPRERGRHSAAISRPSPTEVESSCYFFWRSAKNTRLRYFQKVAFLSSFLVGTRRQPSSCKTPPRKRFYSLGRSVFINMQLAASREPLSPEDLSPAPSNGPECSVLSYVVLSGKRRFLISRMRDLERDFLVTGPVDRAPSAPMRASDAVNRKLRRQTSHRLRDSMAQTTHDCHTRECNLLRYRWI